MTSKITFSKEIANTIGLEEAVLLEHLKQEERLYGQVSMQQISSDVSFWSNEKILEVLTQLIKTGLINETIIDGVTYFSSKKHNKKIPTSYRDKWVPDKDVIDQINEYGIPEDFVYLQIDDFRKLNQERNEKDINWGVKFLRFVIKKWRHKEVEDNKKMKTKPIDKNWVPDMDAKEILINSGINEDFIDKEVPEFVLYWKERKEESDIWNSKFIAHIRRPVSYTHLTLPTTPYV